MYNLAIRKCTSPTLLAPRLKIFKWKFTTPPGIEPRTCWTRGRHATIWASAASWNFESRQTKFKLDIMGTSRWVVLKEISWLFAIFICIRFKGGVSKTSGLAYQLSLAITAVFYNHKLNPPLTEVLNRRHSFRWMNNTITYLVPTCSLYITFNTKARRAGSHGSMSASGSAGPGFIPRRVSKFSFENFQPRG